MKTGVGLHDPSECFPTKDMLLSEVHFCLEILSAFAAKILAKVEERDCNMTKRLCVRQLGELLCILSSDKQYNMINIIPAFSGVFFCLQTDEY